MHDFYWKKNLKLEKICSRTVTLSVYGLVKMYPNDSILKVKMCQVF